jgi:hypothetical protein
MVNCPYDKMTLTIALLGIEKKLEKYEQDHGAGAVERLFVDKKVMPPESGAELNRQASEHHGISVETLVNSPNYATLKQEYAEHMIGKAVATLEENLGLSNVEAWAMLLANELGDMT